MRKWLVIAAITAQVGVLAYMMASRELILYTGKTVVVRTAPIDPRDPFRGDFVRLSYPFSQIDVSSILDSAQRSHRGKTVYAVLRQAAGGIYEFDHVSDSPPADGVFLKGKVVNRGVSWRGNTRINYGIEQLFVEQGKGKEIEKRRGNRNSMQVPMEVQLAVSNSGVALIKGYDWSALGIKTELVRTGRERARASRNNPAERQTPAPTIPPRRSPLIKITLRNASAAPLSVHNPGQDCGFVLIHLTRGNESFEPANKSCDEAASEPVSQPIELQPGEEHTVELDLAKPRWHITSTDKNGKTSVGEIGELAARQTFRLVYSARTPGKPTVSAAAIGNLWQGELPSRAFRGMGLID